VLVCRGIFMERAKIEATRGRTAALVKALAIECCAVRIRTMRSVRIKSRARSEVKAKEIRAAEKWRNLMSFLD